ADDLLTLWWVSAREEEGRDPTGECGSPGGCRSICGASAPQRPRLVAVGPGGEILLARVSSPAPAYSVVGAATPARERVRERSPRGCSFSAEDAARCGGPCDHRDRGGRGERRRCVTASPCRLDLRA